MPKAARKPRASSKPQIPFSYKLVLNQWLFSLFDLPSTDGSIEWQGKRVPLLEAFRQKFNLVGDAAEGLDENNIHRFHHALTNVTVPPEELPADLLLEYDQNIVRHTQRLNERRLAKGEELIRWKYFQYLTLLFTEIYLDRYFGDPEALAASLNEQIARYNDGKPESDQVPPLELEEDVITQLNKLAFWNATGSGKTLIMHVNIMQYQHYLDTHGRRRDLNRIILLTPNEGLSLQHKREFEASGIQAELFKKDSNQLFMGHAVEILDINKLRDEMGDKTVAVDAFESNNLVLIDEGHRGASAGETGSWMRFRNQLCEKGFSFEYSATFGQAVKGDKGLTNQYARCVLFDYSYRYFYNDGYGKDYHILNIDAETESNYLELYLTACLLAFFQQQRLFLDHEKGFAPFNLEKPLWIFVGGKVTASLSNKDASDIVEILLFLSRFLADRAGSIDRIRRILYEGLVGADGRNIFSGRFAYLNEQPASPEKLFDDILATVFNAQGGGALHVENLKGVTGEVSLRVGDNDPFGVINVGDDTKLCKLCEDYDKTLVVGERDFSASLFHGINQTGSTVNLLIGSKKFTEGWSSWRVATMGLMNVGKSEGSQIIQLFGRGVRLKGFKQSLKRSSSLTIPVDVPKHRHIRTLETLNIFGIKADYMAQFREFLEEEGLPTNDDLIEFHLPIIRNLGRKQLKTIRLKKEINGISTEFGDAFKKLARIPTLRKPEPAEVDEERQLIENRVIVNWYPRLQKISSKGASGGEAELRPDECTLKPQHVAFLDIDALFFGLQRFKAERGWHNFNLPQAAIPALLSDNSWYRLFIPESEMRFERFDKVALWQELALALLKKYCERYYTFRKKEWELPHLEYRYLEPSDPNFPAGDDEYEDGYHRILIDQSKTECERVV